MKFRFHLIANAHLDPVWLWDWREGLNEALSTTRAMLDLLDEDPALTVVRGETALYEFVEREDPALFSRIRAAVTSGRWELVGGTYVQADHNLPSTAVLLQQYAVGQEYFRSRFGRSTTVAWAPDAFGHSAGLPEILAASGIRYFAHCRPFPKDHPLPNHTYWWEGAGGARILSYRSPVDWYCHERSSLPERLDAYLAAAQRSNLENIAIFYGLGNHGGGPTRRILRDLREWSEAHPEILVEHSGLERYFRSVEVELALKPTLTLPVIRGELGFSLRGCFASTAKIKHAYRRAEHQLLRSQRTRAVVAHTGVGVPPVDLSTAERTLLFNSFHDILPGSSIERAYDEQIAQLGGVHDAALRAEFSALNALARAADTRVARPPDDQPCAVAFLVLNPHEIAFNGHVELEAQLDWRPIPGYEGPLTSQVPIEVLGPEGQPIAFQRIAADNRAMVDRVWRVRVAAEISLPPFGWQIISVGYRETPILAPARSPLPVTADSISNELLTVRASVGDESVRVTRADGSSIFGPEGLRVSLFEDPYGSWGGMNEEEDSWHLTKEREQWSISHVTLLEHGPEIARLWMRFSGSRSRVDLTFTLARNRPAIDVAARVFIDERSARLKLCLPGFDRARFEVPGGECERTTAGEYAGIGYVCARGSSGELGFTSDVLSGFSLGGNILGVTLARATRYADDVPTPPDQLLHRPAVDSGELRCNFVMTPQIDHIRACSRFLQQPLVAQSVPATPGTLSRAGHANIADTSNIVSLQDKGAYRQKLSRTGEPGAITFHRLP